MERQVDCWGPAIEDRGTPEAKAELLRLQQKLASAMTIGKDGKRQGQPNLDDPLMQRYLREGYYETLENPDGSTRVW